MSLLQSKSARIFFKLYEPFIYSFCLSITSTICVIDYYMDGMFITEEDMTSRMFLMALLGGYSLPTLARVFAYSSGLCMWYKANMLCLLLNLAFGLLYYFKLVEYLHYMIAASAFGIIGVISSLIFKIFYRISSEVDCHHIQ